MTTTTPQAQVNPQPTAFETACNEAIKLGMTDQVNACKALASFDSKAALTALNKLIKAKNEELNDVDHASAILAYVTQAAKGSKPASTFNDLLAVTQAAIDRLAQHVVSYNERNGCNVELAIGPLFKLTPIMPTKRVVNRIEHDYAAYVRLLEFNGIEFLYVTVGTKNKEAWKLLGHDVPNRMPCRYRVSSDNKGIELLPEHSYARLGDGSWESASACGKRLSLWASFGTSEQLYVQVASLDNTGKEVIKSYGYVDYLTLHATMPPKVESTPQA